VQTFVEALLTLTMVRFVFRAVLKAVSWARGRGRVGAAGAVR
jgi:hypothetical protein